ncbi:hypothetical protein EW146_g6491 [Bondarzewia mesenterica]|uniref:Uncharacterized protein n=1 Tax=Bondarzewia mesenterica TaxID=1095465 RepID=A0A4S4LNC7_9AGAM|nr:hypothetical protein EW146_g6491 [Bondarzewia mesenterica]
MVLIIIKRCIARSRTASPGITPPGSPENAQPLMCGWNADTATHAMLSCRGVLTVSLKYWHQTGSWLGRTHTVADIFDPFCPEHSHSSLLRDQVKNEMEMRGLRRPEISRDALSAPRDMESHCKPVVAPVVVVRRPCILLAKICNSAPHIQTLGPRNIIRAFSRPSLITLTVSHPSPTTLATYSAVQCIIPSDPEDGETHT